MNRKVSADKGLFLEDPRVFQRLVGKLIYLRVTRPDFSYTVVSQYMHSCRMSHVVCEANFEIYQKSAKERYPS